MVKIAFCAGHGINTPGKRSPDDEREWRFNNVVALAFEKEMLKYKDVELLRTDDRTGNTDVPLATRTNKANAWNADLYVSFHQNGLHDDKIYREHTGVETYVYSLTNSKKALEFAKATHPALVRAFGIRDRGIKEKNLHIVRETNMPAVLFEGGFVDSKTDIFRLRDKQVLENYGTGIAQELAKYFNLKKKEENKVTVLNPNVALSTFRKEAIQEIKNAVSDERFTAKHEKVEQYSDEELMYYSMIALFRRK